MKWNEIIRITNEASDLKYSIKREISETKKQRDTLYNNNNKLWYVKENKIKKNWKVKENQTVLQASNDLWDNLYQTKKLFDEAFAENTELQELETRIDVFNKQLYDLTDLDYSSFKKESK